MGADGWGTWEELILGGAVLRHGTSDWNVVASELRARTLCPYTFTPQACKARYEDLQKRFSGSTTWFEELRKRRVAELKRELAKSEDSIGSLELKIKSLKGEKQHSNQVDYVSSETESPLPALDSEATESFGREEASNDQNSAGSFTKDTSTRRTWLSGPRNQAVETDTKPSTSASSEQDKDVSIKKMGEVGYGNGVIIRKRRGQRKRKDCNWTINERSVSESDNLGSSNVVSTAQKETSINNCGPIIRDSGNNNGESCNIRRDGLIEIFKSVAESEPASVFRHRMDSQKRARYRRVIKQHMDIGTIKSRIVAQSIKSAKELFRDLLLVANNALVFYSRRTREYKSALSLRNLVMKEYKQHCRGYCHEATSAFIPCNPPVKPRTVRPRPPPCKDRASEKTLDAETNVVPDVTLEGSRKKHEVESNLSRNSSVKARKGVKRPAKVKPGIADAPPSKICPVKPRKRVRR